MYYYNIGYFSFEDSGYVQLVHSKKFTEEEFNEMVYICFGDVIKKIKKEIAMPIEELEKYYSDKDNDEDYIFWHCDYNNKISLCFMDIYRYIAYMLCKNFGFEYLKFEADFSIFGWDNLNDKEDNYRSNNPIDSEKEKKLRDIINENLADIQIHPSHFYENEDIRK